MDLPYYVIEHTARGFYLGTFLDKKTDRVRPHFNFSILATNKKVLRYNTFAEAQEVLNKLELEVDAGHMYVRKVPWREAA